MNWLLNADFSTAPTPLPLTLLGLSLAFVSGHIIAWVYMLTHSGLSYSKTFVQSLMILPVIVALVMMVLSNNIVYAFGLMAVFAIVRFRNILRDTLDTTYVLGVIVVGMACGTFKFMTAMIGCLLICSILLYLWMTGFGNRQRFDVILNLHWAKEINQIQELEGLLKHFTTVGLQVSLEVTRCLVKSLAALAVPDPLRRQRWVPASPGGQHADR